MAADPDVTKALGATNLFAALKPRALDRIASAARVVKHPAGSKLATEGESGIGFHLITDGTAQVEVKGEKRGEIGPGQYFGEISLIDGKPRSATVTATSDLTTVSLTAWEFGPLLESEPEVARALLVVLCQRLRAAEQR